MLDGELYLGILRLPAAPYILPVLLQFNLVYTILEQDGSLVGGVIDSIFDDSVVEALLIYAPSSSLCNIEKLDWLLQGLGVTELFSLVSISDPEWRLLFIVVQHILIIVLVVTGEDFLGLL